MDNTELGAEYSATRPEKLSVTSAFTRRRFVGACSVTLASLFLPRRAFGEMTNPRPHPTPRPGITGEHVLTPAQLAEHPKLIPLFDSIREIPQIVDGIRCNCGCTNPPKFYSLLSCYGGDGMARDCLVCQGQGRLAARLHSEGKTLDQIRAAIDAKFG
jgi:hypothetical protein